MNDIIIRSPRFSARIPRRIIVVNAILALLIVLLAAPWLFVGAYPISLAELFSAFTGNADPIINMIIMENRIPHGLTAIGVGLAFGIAGEMIQTLLRNPLASPDIIGFSAGASCGAVLSVVITGSSAMVLPASFVGGLLAATLVILLSWRRGISPNQIVLIGIGVTLTISVITELLMTHLNASYAAQLVKWLVGSFGDRSLSEVKLLWLGIFACLPLLLWHQFALARMTLDDNLAMSLGIPLTRARLLTIALAVILVAMAVASAGPLPFVAFVAGPIAHGLTRAPRPTLISAGLVGAIIALLADAASLSMPSNYSLPAGVFTALVGAPVLIWVLIIQSKKRHP